MKTATACWSKTDTPPPDRLHARLLVR